MRVAPGQNNRKQDRFRRNVKRLHHLKKRKMKATLPIAKKRYRSRLSKRKNLLGRMKTI